jgi:diguanylate cyclase (GGDEF)-like protein
MLPDRSGYELDASLQRDPATLAIPVLFLPGQLPPVTAEERLRSLTGLARLGMGPVAVILADMDGFAEVNERCGYAVGDRLLQAFAGLLHESCRAGDTVARLEAKAFLLLLPGTKLDAAWYVAERVRRRTAVIGAALGPDGPTLTASFGGAEHRPRHLARPPRPRRSRPHLSQTSRPQPLRGRLADGSLFHGLDDGPDLRSERSTASRMSRRRSRSLLKPRPPRRVPR